MKRHRFYSSIILFSGLLMATLSTAQAADPARGKELYAANCTACHTKLMNGDPTAIHTRPKSIIHSYESLQKRVRFCESMTGAQWGDNEINDVVAYLNQDFYKFKEKQP